MKTNDLSAPVTDLDTSLVTIAAWDSRSLGISRKETKRTKVRRVGFAFILAVALGSCVITELCAQVIVVPNSLATNDGNTFITTPVGGPTSVREMTIYDAAQFADLSGPSFLTQFALRPDTTPGPSGPALADSADLRLDEKPLGRRGEHDLRREPRHEQHAGF